MIQIRVIIRGPQLSIEGQSDYEKYKGVAGECQQSWRQRLVRLGMEPVPLRILDDRVASALESLKP